MFPFGQFWVQTSSHASAVAALAATLFSPNINIHNHVLKGFWHAQNMVRVYTFEKNTSTGVKFDCCHSRNMGKILH